MLHQRVALATGDTHDVLVECVSAIRLRHRPSEEVADLVFVHEPIVPASGSGSQSLVRLVKREDGSVEETTLAPVVFVPLLSGTLD